MKSRFTVILCLAGVICPAFCVISCSAQKGPAAAQAAQGMGRKAKHAARSLHSKKAATAPEEAAAPGSYVAVKQTGQRTRELWDGGRKLFEAQVIYASEKMADGTWLVEAVTGSRPPMQPEGRDVKMVDGKETMDVSPRELWTIAPHGGKPRRLTPANMDACDAVVSPDDRWVGFSGVYVKEGGVIDEPEFFLIDFARRKPVRMLDNQGKMGDYFTYTPRWNPDSKSLEVTVYSGEIGSRQETVTVRVPRRR